MAYSGVYVFGDSLVDPGNALKLTSLTSDHGHDEESDECGRAQQGNNQ
jgi:hypothetical protein